MRRREFIMLLGGASAASPLAARAQQPALPVIGFVRDGSADASLRSVVAFRKGLSETGYVEGQNVTVEYHWLEGRIRLMPTSTRHPLASPVSLFCAISSVVLWRCHIDWRLI